MLVFCWLFSRHCQIAVVSAWSSGHTVQERKKSFSGKKELRERGGSHDPRHLNGFVRADHDLYLEEALQLVTAKAQPGNWNTAEYPIFGMAEAVW